jgi:hypothetical protein
VIELHHSYEIAPYKAISRESVCALEDALAKIQNVDPDSLTSHYFAPGVYARCIRVDAGTTFTGKIHKFSLMNILVHGRVRVNIGDRMEEVEGPLIFTHEPGAKRAFYTLTDIMWINIVPTDLTDPVEIENDIIAPSFAALEDELKCLG